jgi:hypothetical protein
MDFTISPDLTSLCDVLVSKVMGLSLVRAALKKCALGGILESKKQEQLISAIENQVQHALAPEAGTSAGAPRNRSN